MKAYSEDLRRKIVQAVSGGMSKSEVARTFGLSLSSVKRYVGIAREGRSLTPKKRPGLRPKFDEQAKRILQADLQERPVATLPQRRAFLQRVAGVRVSDSTISRAIKRLGWSYKKRSASIAIMVLAASRLGGLTRKKEGLVPFQRSVDRFGECRGGAAARSQA